MKGEPMQRITIEKFRNNPIFISDSVIDNQEPVTVSVAKDREVVLMDVEDYTSIPETLHLLSNPANAERLREGIRQHRKGQRKVIDVEAYMD